MAEGGKAPNTKKWEDFFKPLKTPSRSDEANEERSDCPLEDDPDMEDLCSQNPILANFIGKLKLQKLYHDKEKEKDLGKEKLEIVDTLRSLMKDFKQHKVNSILESRLFEESWDSLQKAFKEYNKIDSQKPDMKKSGSTWTLAMIAKYFSLDVAHYAKSDITSERRHCNKANPEIQDILELLGIAEASIFSSSTNLCRLQHQDSLSEYSVRMILDSLLQSICRQARSEEDFEIIIRPEHSMKRQGLPTNIFDYVLICMTSSRSHPQRAVGIIEAKKPDTMNQKTVAQLVIQLMSLLTTSENPDSAYFGVLTDGYRFLFAYANKDGIYFENKWHDDGDPTVLVHEAETWDDLDFIKSKIVSLCCIVDDHDLFSDDHDLSSVYTSKKYISCPKFTIAKARHSPQY